MFKYVINNMRVFMFVAGFAGALAFLAVNSAMAGKKTKPTKIDMHTWEPGSPRWGQWQCSPNGTPGDTVLPWPNARAKLEIDQKEAKTHLKIKVSHAAPDTLWTVWFIHAGQGTSPLTGSAVTPMANPSEIPELIRGTPHEELIPALEPFGDQSGTCDFEVGDDPCHVGTSDAPNVFFTDSRGKGTYEKILDFPLIKGAYPYQEAASFIFDAFGVTVEGMKPIPNSVGGPPHIAIVSHCVDGAAHGLLSYSDERWFALRVNPFE